MTAALALVRQDRPHLVDLGDRDQGALRAGMAGLSTYLPPALLPSAPGSCFASQPVGGWRLGRVGGVLFAERQLPLEIGDLPLPVTDPLLLFTDLRFCSAMLG
jgi:hypothetical protein